MRQSTELTPDRIQACRDIARRILMLCRPAPITPEQFREHHPFRVHFVKKHGAPRFVHCSTQISAEWVRDKLVTHQRGYVMKWDKQEGYYVAIQ